MKTLYLTGGTMGVGKTAVSQRLKRYCRLAATGVGMPTRFR